MPAKMTPEVQAVAVDQGRSDDTFEVVLELDTARTELSGNRAERIAKLKDLFQRRAAVVKAAVVQSGGTIQAEAWINCSIKARVPGRALATLREIDGIVRIDAPGTITREG